MGPRRTSRVNTFFMCATVMGLGMIGGFLIFFGAWQNRCAEVLAHADARCNASVMYVKEQHASMRSKEEKELKHRKFAELEDCLSARNVMAGKYQDLLQQHEDTKIKVSESHKESEAHKHTINNLNEQIKRLQRELGQSTIQNQNLKQQCEKQQEALKNQLQLARSMLLQKAEEMESLKLETPACDEGTEPPSLVELRAAIQRRALAQTFMRYGHGPYRVQFTMDFSHSGDSLSSFQVEFARASDMPHTIWTFLNLVERGLYKGTTIALKDEQSLVGGSPSHSIHKRTQAELARRYAEFGYGVQPFLFDEFHGRATCDEGGFSIIEHGPDFRIFLNKSDDQRSRSCAGKVTSGLETLHRFHESLSQEHVRIVDVIVLNSSHDKDEL
jgi:hypothetical protein